MSTTPLGYRALVRLAVAALPLARPFSEKLARGDRERRAALDRWLAWAATLPRDGRPLLWVHAPSVGEGLQAEAVLAILRARHPRWRIMATFFSPSAEALARRQPVDRADYLPYDGAPNVARLLAALAPRAVVFTKLDLWPELATQAAAAGAAVGMIAATVSPVSGRRHPLARRLARAGYAALAAAGAISEADAAGLAALGTPADRITITGDPRFDSALAKAAAIPPDAPGRRLVAGAPTLVAGSTWGPDEAALLAAFRSVRAAAPDARLVLVPHEPGAAHLARLDREAARHGLDLTRLSVVADGAPVPAAVVVDRVGMLAGLYAGAALAYVGGGFGSAGLHSVLEPAACGVPVVVGPRWQSSREAGLLRDAGALAVAADAEAVGHHWLGWIRNRAGRETAGRNALAVVERGAGAAARNAALVTRLMEG